MSYEAVVCLFTRKVTPMVVVSGDQKQYDIFPHKIHHTLEAKEENTKPNKNDRIQKDITEMCWINYF
jgi:hypothetical protein